MREAYSLGSLPQIFTTNSSEAINSFLKKAGMLQEDIMAKEMKLFVESQQNETICSLLVREHYTLAEPFVASVNRGME